MQVASKSPECTGNHLDRSTNTGLFGTLSANAWFIASQNET
jgi:hypothetical protein